MQRGQKKIFWLGFFFQNGPEIETMPQPSDDCSDFGTIRYCQISEGGSWNQFFSKNLMRNWILLIPHEITRDFRTVWISGPVVHLAEIWQYLMVRVKAWLRTEIEECDNSELETQTTTFTAQSLTAYPRIHETPISIGMPNFEMPNLDSVNHCTSKEMPKLDSVNHCTSKTESRFGISTFGIPIEIRRPRHSGFWIGDYGWGVRVRRPFGARGMSSVRYRTRLGDLKNKQSTERESHVHL